MARGGNDFLDNGRTRRPGPPRGKDILGTSIPCSGIFGWKKREHCQSETTRGAMHALLHVYALDALKDNIDPVQVRPGVVGSMKDGKAAMARVVGHGRGMEVMGRDERRALRGNRIYQRRLK